MGPDLETGKRAPALGTRGVDSVANVMRVAPQFSKAPPFRPLNL